MSARPKVKGWCPGAHRPMMAGDGLLLRIRPRMGRITRHQAQTLCRLSDDFGNGYLDLTSRANLQLRGVSSADFDTVLSHLMDAKLLDPSPEIETRRNIIVAPDWKNGDLTHRLNTQILEGLADWPDLPPKIGLAIDTGKAPVLRNASADFRFERGADDRLILRADGATTGIAVEESRAGEQLLALASWFASSGGARTGRMARHLRTQALPKSFLGAAVVQSGDVWAPGQSATGAVYGAPFGALKTTALLHLMQKTGATALRTTPWRLFVLEDGLFADRSDFVVTRDDPLLNVHACLGAPACREAEVETRTVARRLASTLRGGETLHVSGCAKGCAFPGRAGTTLVGASGKFDLVRAGTAWEEPDVRGLKAEDLTEEIMR